jgi:hypothetical protein
MQQRRFYLKAYTFPCRHKIKAVPPAIAGQGSPTQSFILNCQRGSALLPSISKQVKNGEFDEALYNLFPAIEGPLTPPLGFQLQLALPFSVSRQ